jgi:HK97 family phage prohead protease
MTTATIERRTLTEPVEFRSEGDRVVARGYASVFNRLSQNLGGFVERVAPSAFARTITEQDIRALFNHSEDLLLGRSTAGTLRLEEDGTGLHYEIDLPDTTVGRDVAVLLERGDLSGSSFGFRVIEDEWSETDSGFPLRTLRQVSLRDVGPVTFPAYTDSTSALRSLAEARSLDLNDLVAAADRGELRTLIAPAGGDDHGDASDEGRVNPTFSRQRISWLT